MGIANIINNSTTTSGGEIVRELVNSSDGAGLHFDGAAGNIDIASPPDLGTAFSFEFVIKADEWGTDAGYFLDFSTGGRFIFGTTSSQSYNISIYDNSAWGNFGVKVLDDLKVHHLVVTVDGTAATLYDNGNQVGTLTISGSHGIDSCSDLAIGPGGTGTPMTFYRTRFYNKALTSTEVQTAFERADVDFADQYGSQSELVTNGTFAADSNWTKGTGWSIGSGVASSDGTQTGNSEIYQSVSFTAGKRYRLSYEVTAFTSGQVRFLLGSGGTGGTWRSATGTYVEEFVADSASTSNLHIQANSTFVGSIDNVSFKAIGCVSDYQTQWANPTQSLTVQDASGSADGTCSASGVSQVQPIIQGNLTSLAVTTSQQAAGVPADGAVVADNVGIGVAPDVKLAIKDNVDNSNESGIRLLRSANSDCGWINMRGGAFNINTRNNAANAGLPVKVKMHGSEVFTIASDGNIEQHTDTNGITKFVVKNENTGTSARALVQAVSDGANMDLWANSASYTGVAGWADSGVISTGSTTSGGMKINAVAGGLSLQTNQTARLTIANSTGLATFSNGVTLSGGILALTDSSGGALPVLTISSGEITITSSVHQVEVESSTTDDLIKINGGTVGAIVMLRPQTSNTVVVKDQASGGNFLLAGDFSMSSNHDTITLLKTGTYWQEISRSDNA